MIGAHCKYTKESDYNRSLLFNVKRALGKEYKFEIFKTIADSFEGDIKDLNLDYVLKHYPRKNLAESKAKKERKNLADKIQQHQGYWTRQEVDANPRILYVFTDNTDRDSGSARIDSDSWYAKKYGNGLHYPTQTTAVIRGKENARPISTVKWFYKNHPGVAYPKTDKTSQALWHDSDVEEFKKVVREELQEIVNEFNTGKYDTIMFPSGDGLFNAEISDISKSRTPELYKALSDLLTEFGFESLIPSNSETQTNNKKTTIITPRKNLARYAVKVNDDSGIEVSSAGDEFGRQFSALAAVFPEGTSINIKIGGKKGEEYVYDIGGYSIEAAYQMIKGYTRNPKGRLIDNEGKLIKVNGKKIQIQGKNKAPISNTLKIVGYNRSAVTKEMRENHSYQNAYLPLWKLWASLNPELIQQLREKAGEEKILTDKFATNSSVSQARALAEILWGTPEIEANDREKKEYELQRQKALEAVEDITKAVKLKGNDTTGIKFIDKTKITDKQAAYLASGLNTRGEVVLVNGKKTKGYLVAFKTNPQGVDRLNMNLTYFVNPFEGQPNAIKKFIQWIIPDAYASLPKELKLGREYEGIRNTLRTYFSKGGYTQMEILSGNSPEDILYAKTLRYIIDNFRALRQRYNPTDITEFANLHHNVKVTPDTSSSSDAVLRFIPNESVGNTIDDLNSVRLDRFNSKEKEESDYYVVSFPEDFHDQFSSAQQQRLVKSIAAAIPEGATVTLDASLATQQLLNTFDDVVKFGYDRVDSKEVTMNDGSTKEVGIYQRRPFTNSQVEKRSNYTPQTVKDNWDNKFYIFENASDKQLENTSVSIYTWHNNKRQASSYYSDKEDFERFKKEVDKAIDKAKQVIDEGGTVVIPKEPMGTSSALYHYAPKCYEYINQRLQELENYGNRGEVAQRYMASSTTTVKPVENNPAENINLDINVIQNPKMQLYQRFTNTEIRDLAGFYNEIFYKVLDSQLYYLKQRLQKEIEQEQDAKQKNIKQHVLKKLNNPEKQFLETLNQIPMKTIFAEMQQMMRLNIESAKAGRISLIGKEGIPLLETSLNTRGFFNLIFNYAIPLIEDNIGIRITATEGAVQTISEAAQRDQAEDVAGEDSPEMGWSYNHRLVNPFTSLTASIRKMLNNIEMRDPNDLRKKITDSLGRPKKYNSQYIYASIMSRMAKMTLGEINNFMTITPVSQLSEKEARKYPYGKPSFPVLEEMKYQYSWAADLIQQLEVSHKLGSVRIKHSGKTDDELLNDKVAMSSIGNIASQFYTNFCQHFVKYATMTNGKVIEENRSIGTASLKQSVINNYEGNIRFKGVDMVYNSDGSVNNDNLQSQIDKVRELLDKIMHRNNGRGKVEYSDKEGEAKTKDPFWIEIDRLQKILKEKEASHSTASNSTPLIDTWQECAKEHKEFIHEITNALKASGIQFNDFDIFTFIMDPKAKAGIGELLSEYLLCLKSIIGLPKNEHIFESSKYTEYEKGWTRDKIEHNTPKFYWNKFFEKFGDIVTERELVDSTRIFGKSRYSYTYPSYMSMSMLNLTNPNRNVVKKYIEENFMPYEWFYDKATGKFKNKILEYLYEKGGWFRESDMMYGPGHDMLVKKDGYEELEYQDWSPADILQIMFQELNQPTNNLAGNFFIPVLSDSKICKVIQAPKVEVREALEGMRSVVLQELWRMDFVEKRNIIFRMQDIQQAIDDGLDISNDERAYYNKYLSYYESYKRKYPQRLEKVENFDVNGSKFCFFPELNSFRISRDIAVRSNNLLMQQISQVLSADPLNPNNNTIDLKTAIKALQAMPEDTFNSKAQQVGMNERHYGDYTDAEGQAKFGEYYSTITKEAAINALIDNALQYIMDRKVNDFVYDVIPSQTQQGVFNENVLNAILKADEKLMERWNKRPQETENHTLSDKEREELRGLNTAIFNQAQKFYWGHTHTMAQFLQLMVTDIAYYKDPNKFFGSIDFGKRFKETYGAGMKLNTNSKFGKKIERNIILKDRVRRSVSMDTLKKVLQRAVDEGRILDVEMEAVLDKFKGIKGTDAQAYRSLTSWRDIMDMIGKCDETITQAIENLRNNKWTMSDFYTVFQTIKPFTYGPEDQDGGVDRVRMRTMVQHKNSEAVLLAIYNTLVGSAQDDVNYSPRLRGLNRAMEEIELVDDNGNVMKYANGEHMKAIDVAQYHSAVKVGAHGIIDINYSRKKLKDIQNKGVLVVGGKNLKIGAHETYYSIAKRLGKAVDSKAISEEEYNEAMDWLEPDENEVFEIIRNSIYKDPQRPGLGFNNQVLHKIPYAYYSIQQPTPNHFTDNDEGTFGSQPRHIIMADLPENFSITINGKKYNREQIRERYSGLLVANLLECYEKEIEPLFNDVDKSKTPAQRLHDRLKPIIEGNPKYSKSLLDAIETDEKGNFIMPLNNLTVAHQLEEILTSMFKNAIHRQTINGGNAIIAADEGVGYSKSLKIRGKRDAEGKLTEIEGIECYLPAQARKMLEPFMEKKTKKFLDENGAEEEVEYYELNPEKLAEAGLEKAIGYRIPTEGLYSIMPLIIRGFLPQQSGSSIVLAQEVVTLTGSDNDVDKMFLMLKQFTEKKGKIKAVSTPKEKEIHPLDMSKEQRDNEIIDIFYGITTHPQMSHLWLSPGNFDTLKMEAQKNKILKTKYLRDIFMVNAGISPNDYEALADLFTKNPNADYTELYRKVMQKPSAEGPKTMLDVVVDFTGEYQRALSPVYPDTFIKMHQIYMAGVAEKGIFANNTLDHAKLQWVDINLADHAEFVFQGRRIKKIDERYVEVEENGKKYRHYISKDCSECSAASVDNGKDPQLDDINSNKQTATFFGFLLRTTIGIDGAGALMAQPLVDWAIRRKGNIDKKMLYGAISDIETWLTDNGFDLSDEMFNWQTHNFSVKEWHLNTMNGYLPNLLKGRDTSKPNMDRIVSLYCTYKLVLSLLGANQDMQEPRNIIHYDSPTHAADTSFGGVVAQTKAVQEVNNRKINVEPKRIYGEEEVIIYELEKRMAEGSTEKKLKDFGQLEGQSPYRKLYNAIMSSPMPITQGFYTLGIEKIRSEFRGQFAFGREEIQHLTDVLWDYMKVMKIYSPEKRIKIISQMYKDWIVYRLSKTKLFGNDDTMTYDEKRQYYLYQFPEEFMRLKQQIPELNDIEATRNMYVEKGIIMMHRGQKTSTTLRDFITDSFDALIQHGNPKVQEVAKKLFMYTYYLNGFDFNYFSFGNMMSTQFQTAFPEYIQALRDMLTENISEQEMDNFFDQMLVKRSRNGLLPRITYTNASKRAEGLQKGYHDTGQRYDPEELIPEYVQEVSITSMNKVNTEILRLNRALSEMHNSIIYEPVRLNTSFHFNANQTLNEMLDTVYDQELINRNKGVGAYKRNIESVQYYNNQNSKDMREITNERDANVPELPANGKEVENKTNAAVNISNLDSDSKLDNVLNAIQLEDSRELSDDILDEAAGKIQISEVDPYDKINDFEMPEKYLKQLDDKEDKTNAEIDPDILEGEEIVKKTNNGKLPC